MSDEFWVVEFQTNGFGNNTVVDTIWRTEEEAKQCIEDKHDKRFLNYKIAKGFFGQPINLIFN